jgi:phosphate transport system substrate-binding protein
MFCFDSGHPAGLDAPRARWRRRHVAALLPLVLLISACSRQAGDSTRITVVGSSTIAPLMAEIAKLHEANSPNVRVDVQTGGSTRGVVDVRSGVAQLGMISRALKAEESDLQRLLLGRDGVGVIVHKSNPVRQLTREQVARVFNGTVRNWKELGGPELPISVISKAEGRSTLEVFSGYFGVSYKDIKAQVVIGDNQQGIQTVGGLPGAIGYVSIGSAEHESRLGAAIRLVSIDGQAATTEAVAAGIYPVSRELNLVFKPAPPAAVQALLREAQSAAATRLVQAQFFVPVPH